MTNIERIAHVAHEANRALQVTSLEHVGDVSPHFMEAPEWMVQSALEGVTSALEGKTPEQLHESWVDYKVKDGWAFGEAKDAVAKTHPCLVPYGSLSDEQKLKDKVFLAIVQALGADDD